MKNPSTARICGMALATALAVAFSGLAAVSAAPKYKQMPEDGWVAYVDDALGYNFYYPSTFFEPFSQRIDSLIAANNAKFNVLWCFVSS